jgi:hypothetical protein
LNDLGWHIQIHMKGEQIAGIEDLLLRVRSPIVFDHLGRLGQPNPLDNPGFKTISKLIDKGKTWVKLSGAYQDTKVGAPSYSDTVPVARAYVKAAPQRMVWALLLVSTLPAGAQQPQPPTTTTGCFKVEMSHSTQGNPQGSILLDRCTGKTWLLLCIRNDTAGCAFQWAPIPDANEPAAAGRTSPPAAEERISNLALGACLASSL